MWSQLKLEEAIDNFKTAINIKPNHAEAYNNLGNVLQTLGNFDKAIMI